MAVESDAAALSPVNVLPDELWLQIIEYLKPIEVAALQQASRKLLSLCLDNDYWKRNCFDDSAWYQNLLRRRHAAMVSASLGDEYRMPGAPPDNETIPFISCEKAQKLQDFVNWDPSYESERVSWYDEYRQRVGPAHVNWLEAPSISDRGLEAIIETRAVSMYAPYDGSDGLGTKMAVSPLDDGSVCLWDVNGCRDKQGGIVARSRPDLLFVDGSGNGRLRCQKIDSNISDRITIDNFNHKAYIAVQAHLMEVDLNRLDIISDSAFEFSISTLSPVHQDKPLVVGTSLGIHLHDFRTRAPGSGIFDSSPLPPYASLSQPTPTSILYLPQSGGGITNDICVGGRFTSILHYDLRRFPSIVKSNYSGARISSLAALPYAFSTLDHEVRASGAPNADMVREMKSKPGSTLIAGGGYHQKGSLEVYGLDPASNGGSCLEPKAVARNRNQAASSPILSVTNHGTKIAFSDGSGLIKWFERDGTTECRSLRIGHSENEGRSTLFSSKQRYDDIASKIISTHTPNGQAPPTNNDNILFWTGERLGMVSFTSSPLFRENDFATEEATAEEQAEQEYSSQMRAALERHADDVKFMTGLGMGTPSAFGL